MKHNIVMEFAEMMYKFGDELKKQIYKAAPFDKTQKGRIVEVVNPRKYKVSIFNDTLMVSAHETYNVGDLVWVKYPRNDSANAFIVCKTQ